MLYLHTCLYTCDGPCPTLAGPFQSRHYTRLSIHHEPVCYSESKSLARPEWSANHPAQCPNADRKVLAARTYATSLIFMTASNFAQSRLESSASVGAQGALKSRRHTPGRLETPEKKASTCANNIPFHPSLFAREKSRLWPIHPWTLLWYLCTGLCTYSHTKTGTYLRLCCGSVARELLELGEG